MLFWHLGLTVAIVFFTLGKRWIDYRVVMLGAILPDLIDKPIGRVLFEDSFQSGRLFAHTLLFVTALLLGIQLSLRGKTARTWFVLPIGALIHLALDGMWSHPVTLFWPLFGTRFPPDPAGNYWLEALLRPFQHPAEGLRELTGFLVLMYFSFAYQLFEKSRALEFLKTGLLREKAGVKSPG